jgi:NAD(P)-dependent dehydrogenase (short-subunit alcohol dehydrogenase family)
MTLRDQRALIIGGTSGLGLATAEAVIERGGTAVVASRRQESVERAVNDLGRGASGVVLDPRHDDALAAAFAEIGQIDHLVYTAGEPLRMTPLAELTPQIVREFWETRYIGALSAVRAAMSVGMIRAGGSIVLTSGNAGRRSGPGWSLGASICGAVDALTRQLALELAPVRVNNVAPGVTRSPLWSNLSAADEDAMYEQIAGNVPVGRVAEPADIALAYVYAMEQPMATGTSVLVDGGAVLV